METLRQRAWAATLDYGYEAATGDAPRRRRVQSAASSPRAAMAARPAHVKLPTDILSEASSKAKYAAIRWENEQVGRWRAEGRLTEDGFLRVEARPLPPYTPEAVLKLLPHLGELDRLAALIDLNGVVKGDFMETHDYIREVVGGISRQEVEKYLRTPEGQALVAEVAYTQVGSIFSSLHEKLKTPAAKALSRKTGPRVNKCSKCHAPGHRATTCTASPEEALANLEAEKRARDAAAGGDGAGAAA